MRICLRFEFVSAASVSAFQGHLLLSKLISGQFCCASARLLGLILVILLFAVISPHWSAGWQCKGRAPPSVSLFPWTRTKSGAPVIGAEFERPHRSFQSVKSIGRTKKFKKCLPVTLCYSYV